MSEREGTLVPVIVAVITAVGVIVAALITVWPSRSEKPPSPPTVSTSPAAHPKYQRFVTMRDETGALTADVPLDWSDQRTNGWYPGNIPRHDGRVGPGMNAAPNAADWFNDSTTPGVFVGASSLLARESDPKQLLEVLDPQGCILADERSYAARGLGGKLQTWNCRSYQWFHLAARPDDHSYLVFVEVKIVDPRDEAARDQVLTSLQVTGTPA